MKIPSEGVTQRKPFSLDERVNETQLAERYRLSREEVREAIAAVAAERSSTEVEVSVVRRKSELGTYLRAVYDSHARAMGFEDTASMLAQLHVRVIAAGVVSPERFGREAVRAGSDVLRTLFPAEKTTVRRRETSEGGSAALDRMRRYFDRQQQHNGEHKRPAELSENNEHHTADRADTKRADQVLDFEQDLKDREEPPTKKRESS